MQGDELFEIGDVSGDGVERFLLPIEGELYSLERLVLEIFWAL